MSEIFAVENLFLIAVALIWIVIAIVQDIRKREVANWWNFSLIIIALAYRSFLSIAKLNYWYVLWGVIGLGVGFIVANAFYYGRIFAGGDAKLLLGLGAVLPLSLNWGMNLRILIWFLVLFLIAGSIYGAVYSIFLAFSARKRFSKEFSKQFKKYRKGIYYVTFLFLILFIIGLMINELLLVWFAILFIIAPWLLMYAKTIEESCMIKFVDVGKLTIGDWLSNEIRIGGKVIKPNWQGLSEKELKLIQKKYKRKVLIKYGIPFTPTFLIAFIAMLIVLGLF